jgi:hypothetical protein
MLRSEGALVTIFSNTILMKHNRIVAILLVFSLLTSCSGNRGLPLDAQEELDKTARTYYTSPWMGSTTFQVLNEVEVRNAWLAKGVESGEMWCVELSVSGRFDDSPRIISAIWIVTQQDAQSHWLAAALETISTSTTIERSEL